MELIRVHDQYYILAASSLADDRTRVLKEGDMFAVFDRYGDVQPVGLGEQGIYHQGTRFLSHLALKLGEGRPVLLNSTVRQDNVLLAVDLSNPDFKKDGRMVLPRGTVHMYRSKFLWQGMCHERLNMRNYGLDPVDFDFTVEFGADFADIFEVRGLQRERKGHRLENRVENGSLLLGYEGLDGVTRQTRITCSPDPQETHDCQFRFSVHLQPKAEETFYFTIGCELQGSPPPACHSYECALTEAVRAMKQERVEHCQVVSSNEQFNAWMNRSLADLHMMVSPTESGPYPYAGVPWFNTPFGRDGIITAFEALWVRPELARGVLSYLAATQATETNPEQDAEPGKILHEAREGEMASLKEIPFGRYYGSVDATPLFVLLAGVYYEWTGDRAFIESIWPHIELALRWMDEYGDVDGDGFVEYFRRSSKGLAQQGWKDSGDSVFYSDGRLAEGPIALCEVQGYVYEAKRRGAEMASALGHKERAEELTQQSVVLAGKFERSFWCEELSTYALALDGNKRQCQVRTSNAGHCLFSGIASQEHAQRVAETLLDGDFFSGWGLRTLAASEKRYNPMSYHNGSIWPHDNAMVAYGLARYGYKDVVGRVLTGLFDASRFVELNRLPELFCGFSRRPGKGPTPYPVACSPQAWASASVFLLLRACLGILVRGAERRVYFYHPFLPEWLRELEIKNLTVGETTVDLMLHRYPRVVGINITRRDGPVEIVTVK